LLHEALHTRTPRDEPDRTALLAALDRVLAERAGEYRFVTVPELMSVGRPVRELFERRGDGAFVAAPERGPRAAAHPWSRSSPASTSGVAGPCASTRATPGARPSTTTGRWRPRCAGWTSAPRACTWSTSTPRWATAATWKRSRGSAAASRPACRWRAASGA